MRHAWRRILLILGPILIVAAIVAWRRGASPTPRPRLIHLEETSQEHETEPMPRGHLDRG